MKTLYYYTDPDTAERTVAAGVIMPDRNLPLSLLKDGVPDSVWLTTNGQFSQGLVRFTLRMPNDRVVPWSDWVARYGDREWVSALTGATGGKIAARARRVCEHQITDHRWVSVIDLFNGEKLWDPRGGGSIRGGV